MYGLYPYTFDGPGRLLTFGYAPGIARIRPLTSLVVPSAVQVRLHWTLNGVDCFNVLGGSVAGGFAASQAIANTIGAAILGRFTSSGLAALCATTTSLISVGLRDIRTANQPEFVSVAAAVPGTGAGNPLPNQLAAVVTLRTALAGRSFRGRAYFGGFIAGENTAAGAILAALNTALVAFVTNMQTDLAASAITLGVISRPFAGAAGPPVRPARLGSVTPVTGIVTRDTKWDTQRRRRQ